MMASPVTGRTVAGFRVKSGWAAVVVMRGTGSIPVVLLSGTVQLSDPSVPETTQPYHDGRGVLEEDEGAMANRGQLIVESTHRSIVDLVTRMKDAGLDFREAGIVVGSMNDPERISNPHIRAHALEGRLFWKTLEDELAIHFVGCQSFLEKEILRHGESILGVGDLKATLTVMGNHRHPWKAEQKLASLAAWIVLTQPPAAQSM
jgi:hypothetical protein